MEAKQAEQLADHLYYWRRKQKYENEDILHAAVCCGFVGMMRFRKALSERIKEFYNSKN